MEALISSLVTGGVILALLGLLWRGQSRRIENLEKQKVDKPICEERHINTKEEFGKIHSRLEKGNEIISEMRTDIALILKTMNGD